MAKGAKSDTKTTAAKPAVAAATKAVTAKKDDVKPVAVTKEEPKKEEKAAATTATKKTTRKATKATAKKPGRKPAKKPAEKVQEVFIEHSGNNYQVEEIIEKIHEVYKAEGHRVGAIKSLRVYIQPENNKAYYVINGKEEGKFVEF